MTMTLRITSRPVVEPISLEEARQHLRLDATGSPPAHPDDALIAAQLTAAREYAENFLGRTLSVYTYELLGDEFPVAGGGIELPMPPIVGVQSIKYLDGAGVEQTLSPSDYQYQVDVGFSTYLFPAEGKTWPTTQSGVANAVRIRYEAGYDDGSSSPEGPQLPKSIRAAILLMLGHLYWNREATTQSGLSEIPLGVAALLTPYQLRRSFA